MRRLGSVLIIAALVCAPGAARAGRPFASCQHPEIFQGGALNVVVLPYEADLDENGNPTAVRVARELPLLIQSASLAAIVKYGSVGSIGLVNLEDDYHCTPDAVFGKVDAQMKDGQALVLVWGSLFENSGGLQVQTYVRLLRKGTRETARIEIGNQPFFAELTAQTVAFPPRRLSPDDLVAIDAAFERSSLIRRAPRDDAPGRPMYEDIRNGRAFGYSVQRVDPNGIWAEVVSTIGETGWVRLSPDIGTRAFADWFPELQFIDGASGYLRIQQGAENAWPTPSRASRARALDALAHYTRLDASGGESIPRAVAFQMSAILRTMDGNVTDPDWEWAIAQLDSARRVAPYSVEASQLASLVRMQRAYTAHRSTWQPTSYEKDLTRSAAVAPDNALVLQNLRTFYALVDTTRAQRTNPAAEIDVAKARRTIGRLDSLGYRKPYFTPDSTTVRRPRVDLNTASADAIARLPGISSRAAALIVRARPFKNLDDPTLIQIIGPKVRGRIEGRAMVSRPAMIRLRR